MNRYVVISVVLLLVLGIYVVLPSSSSKEEVKEVTTSKIENIKREEAQRVVLDTPKSKSPLVKPSSVEIESDIKSLDEPSESVESESSIVQNEQDKVEDDKQDIQNSNIDEVDDVDKSSNEEIDTQNVDREYVEKAIKSGELKPLYDEWKESDGIKYNLYITSTKESEDSNGFTPPLVPSVSTVEVNGNPVTVILPNDAKGYVATQGEDESVEYQPIDTTNNLMAPPTIGE